jgi:hypothetical protein
MNEKVEISRKFREAEIKAGKDADPSTVMTAQEMHELGIKLIQKYALQEDYEILAGDIELGKNPQLVIQKNEQLYFVMIKTCPGDGSHLMYDIDTALEVFNKAKLHNARFLFAGVGLYCAGFGFTIVRNQEYKIDFRGFEDVDLISIEPEELLAFRQYQRIKWNLDENKKPKQEVLNRVQYWIAQNEDSIIVKKLKNKEIVSISSLGIKLDYQVVTDLMTIFPDQIYQVD